MRFIAIHMERGATSDAPRCGTLAYIKEWIAMALRTPSDTSAWKGALPRTPRRHWLNSNREGGCAWPPAELLRFFPNGRNSTETPGPSRSWPYDSVCCRGLGSACYRVRRGGD